jgi:hypothetical protein
MRYHAIKIKTKLETYHIEGTLTNDCYLGHCCTSHILLLTCGFESFLFGLLTNDGFGSIKIVLDSILRCLFIEVVIIFGFLDQRFLPQPRSCLLNDLPVAK